MCIYYLATYNDYGSDYIIKVIVVIFLEMQILFKNDVFSLRL